MEWVLIIVFSSVNGGGVAMETFNTRDKCEIAGKLVKQDYKHTLDYYCIQK